MVDANQAAILLASFVGGGYALGEFLGRLFGLAFALDRNYWADLAAVSGGCLGAVLWTGAIVAMVTA